MKIEVYPDDIVVARKAAAIVADAARAAVAARGRFVMAVSGGRTPWVMLRALASEDLPWKKVHVVQTDERVAPTSDPDRNQCNDDATGRESDRSPIDTTKSSIQDRNQDGEVQHTGYGRGKRQSGVAK